MGSGEGVPRPKERSGRLRCRIPERNILAAPPVQHRKLLDRHARDSHMPVATRSVSDSLALQDIKRMKDSTTELFAVFTADDDFAPMLVVPAWDADHAMDRARKLRAAFPRLQLGLPNSCRRADPRLDFRWPGIGIVSESILSAIEASESREQEEPATHTPVTFERRQRGSIR